MRQLLDKKVDVPQLIDQLEFDPDDLESAELHQPGLYLEASRLNTQVMLYRERMEARHAEARANAGLKFRKRKDDAGRKVHTEGAIDALVTLDPDVMVLRRKLDKAYAYESLTKSLVITYSQRGHVLKMIGDSRNAEINSQVRSVKNNMAANKFMKHARRVRDRYDTLDGHDKDDD